MSSPPRRGPPKGGTRIGILWAALCLFLLSGAPVMAQPGNRPASRPHHKGADKLIKLLELPNKRNQAVAGLLELGSKAAPDLGRALNDPRPQVVYAAAHMLHMLGPAGKAALPDVERACRRKDKRLRGAAIWARSVIRPIGITMYTDHQAGKLIEIDKKGKVILKIDKLTKAWCAERLPSGNYLLAKVDNSMIEVDRKGKVVWKYDHKEKITAAERLPDGRTLFCTQSGVIGEVNRAGKVVWTRKAGAMLYDADRLPSGRTLLTDYSASRVFEIDRAGKTVRTVWKGTGGPLRSQRLPSGNTLIALYGGNRVIEVDGKGKVVFTITGLRTPNEAIRLQNGHTMVAENGAVVEFDAKGKKVRTIAAGRATSVRRY